MSEKSSTLLLGAGVLALSQTLSLWSAGPAQAADRSAIIASPGSHIVAAAGGESGGEGGGEGGEGGGEGGVGVPSSYALNSTDPNRWQYDAKDAVATYAKGASAMYSKALADTGTMRDAITLFLASPSQDTLNKARKAWVAARPAYDMTEPLRYYDGPIEAVETRVNSWPMNEAFVDYTVGAPNSGLINDPNFTIDQAAIAAKNQVSDEADVTTGWHAIEFLLWGQDLDPNGPGARPYTDYIPGKANNDKRRAYLKAVTDQLYNDMKSLVVAWDPQQPNNYAAKFLAMPQREAVGRMLNGVSVLVGSEMRVERMSVGLDSGDQEDEQSCFSDTTHQDFVNDMKGVEAVYYGKVPGAEGKGLADLIRGLDPARADKIDKLMADAKAKINVLGDPWDKVLASPPDSPGRKDGEAAVAALGDLATELKASGVTLGVLVQIPGT